MKTLVIYAHPDTGGHCDAIMRTVRDYLVKEKIDFEILDLYKMKYDPVLREEEHYTRGGKVISKQNQEIQKKILDSQRLIFIYPVWWGSMPAMMKGFFDRVFTSGYAFKYEGKIPRGLLNKKALVFITSGSHSLVNRFLLGSRYIKTVRNDILKFCGVSAKVRHIGSSNRFDDSRKEMIEKTVLADLNSFY